MSNDERELSNDINAAPKAGGIELCFIPLYEGCTYLLLTQEELQALFDLCRELNIIKS